MSNDNPIRDAEWWLWGVPAVTREDGDTADQESGRPAPLPEDSQ